MHRCPDCGAPIRETVALVEIAEEADPVEKLLSLDCSRASCVWGTHDPDSFSRS